MGSETILKGINHIGEDTLTEKITTNFIHFLNWGFVDKGAYFNVNIPQSGSYGGDESRFRPLKDPRGLGGASTTRVWQAFRGNWVWESGITNYTPPIQVSGVFVNGTFHALGSDHYVDYVNGNIVFDDAISINSVVRAEYSYRWINVYDASHIPFFQQTQFESMRIGDDFFLYGSGDRSTLGEKRIQLPAIVIEMVDGSFKPYQLGLGQYSYNDVIFHVIAEDGHTVNKLADILAEQNERTIYLFNTDLLAASGNYPLDFKGSIASGAMTYPQLVVPVENGGFRWRKLSISDTRKQKQTKVHNNLYIKPVRMTTEVVLTTI